MLRRSSPVVSVKARVDFVLFIANAIVGWHHLVK